MSEHKFKVGDKVIDKNFPDTILTVCTVDGDIVEAEPEKYNLPKWTYNAKYLEHVSDYIRTADEIAELFKETEEKDKKEHTLPNPADLMSKMDEDTQRLIEKVEEKVQERTKGYQIGAEDAMKDIQRIKQEQYDKGYNDGQQAGFDKGFILGMKTVIRNVERFLKEIQP